jgi:hypothetical protein
MKKNIYSDKAARQAAMSDIKAYYTGSLSELPKSAREPKGKIVTWNWEPLHETYVVPNIQGAA